MTIPKTHRRVVLVRRPPGEPAESDFRVEEAPVPEPRHGEVLVKLLEKVTKKKVRSTGTKPQKLTLIISTGTMMLTIGILRLNKL